MAADVSPELLEKIRAYFEEGVQSGERIAQLLQKIQSGAGTYADAQEYAYAIGTVLADSFGVNLSSAVLPDGKLYYNIAQSVVRPMLEENYAMAAQAAAQVQQGLNTAAGIGIKAQAAAVNENAIEGIINKLCAAPQYDDIAYLLREPVKTFTARAVDETLKRNAEFQYEADLKPKIVRTAEGGCCKWCSKLAGTYIYPDVPKDVYRRHDNCRCTVEYVPYNGAKRQSVWNKKWTDEEEKEKRISFKTDTKQDYRHTRVGNAEEFNSGSVRNISAHKIEGYGGKVYVSDSAVIKPKQLHAINKSTEEAMRKYGIQISHKPCIVVVGAGEYTGLGKYDAVQNTVYYSAAVFSPQAASIGGEQFVTCHEMWHMQQAESFKNAGWVITENNYGEYMNALNEKCKVRLDNAGITVYNVREITDYAETMYMGARYDEVEAEIAAAEAMKGVK